MLDRFIPNRLAIDFDYAHYMLTEGRKDKENPTMRSPSRKAYQKQLKETFNMNRTQILAFKKKPPTPIEAIPNEFSAIHQSKPTKPRPYIPQMIKQGMMVEFAKNVADIVAASGKKHIVMLSSLDFGRWQTIDMSRYITFLVPIWMEHMMTVRDFGGKDFRNITLSRGCGSILAP